MRICEVTGCDKKHSSRGFCDAHASRFRRYGDPLAKGPREYESDECTVDGCDRQREKREWCALHYRRWRKHGDPGEAEPQAGPRYSPEDRIGRLTIVRFDPRTSGTPSERFRYLCLCECGKEVRVSTSALTGGQTRSCGCLNSELSSKRLKTHGRSGTSIYNIWCGMRDRCTNPRNDAYKHYGGRGIGVCDRWRSSFENFLADMGERPEGKTLDRIDNDGGYEPSNCRWATAAEQTRNSRRTIFTPDLVREARALLASGGRAKEVAAQLGVTEAAVAAVACGQTWVDVA